MSDDEILRVIQAGRVRSIRSFADAVCQSIPDWFEAMEEEFWSKSAPSRTGIDYWTVKADAPLIKEQKPDEMPEVPLPTLPL